MFLELYCICFDQLWGILYYFYSIFPMGKCVPNGTLQAYQKHNPNFPLRMVQIICTGPRCLKCAIKHVSNTRWVEEAGASMYYSRPPRPVKCADWSQQYDLFYFNTISSILQQKELAASSWTRPIGDVPFQDQMINKMLILLTSSLG